MALPPAIFNFRTRPDSVNCSSLCPLSDRGLRFGRNPSPLDSTTSSWDAKFSFRPCSVTNRQAEKCLTAGIDGPMGPLKDPAVRHFLAGTVRRYWGITIIDPKSCTDRRDGGWSARHQGWIGTQPTHLRRHIYLAQGSCGIIGHCNVP